MTQVRRGHRPPAVDVVREHRNWLALVEATGRFLSLPVLRETWPTLEPIDAADRDALAPTAHGGTTSPPAGAAESSSSWATFSAGLTTCGGPRPRT